MTGGRRFGPPDWGQDHLSLDAVVAYVDDELGAGPHQRAEAHLACCPDCRTEVVSQRQARAALRAAACPRLPSSLMHTLRAIPVEAELPAPPPGLGITADGQFVLLRGSDRSGHDASTPRFARGGRPAPDQEDRLGHDAPEPAGDGSRRLSRWARYGAVSGLAIGALAVGALAAPGPTEPPAPGVFGGTVLNGAVLHATAAHLTTPAAVPAVDPSRAPDTGAASATDVTDSATASPDGPDTGVLDPDVRRRLDRLPVAFYRGP